MSSCQLKSNKELSDSEKELKIEEIQAIRLEEIRNEYRHKAVEAAMMYITDPVNHVDMAFNVDRKEGVILALQDVLKVLQGEEI